jgi:protein O-GlcNAc transferase
MNEGLLQNAWRLHRAGNFIEAARLYNEVLKANPRNLGALQMLGFLHFQRQEFEAAEKVMARALKLDPKSVDASYNRGCALQALSRHKEALECFTKAIALKRDHAPAYLNRGTSLFQLGRHSEALSAFDRALAINANYPEALLNRGNALLEMNRAEEALASYERAIALDPRPAILWNNRGNALSELKRFPDALKSYEKAISLDPRYSDAFENRADALDLMDRGDEALSGYERAAALDPQNTSAMRKRARLLAKLNRHEEALSAFDALLALDSNDVAAAISRGVTLESLKRHSEALADLDRALALEPGNADALSNRANTLIALKRFAEAAAATEKALAREPMHAAALHNRASAMVGLRRNAEALALFDKIIAIAPGRAASWNGRGSALMGLKRYEEALTNFDRAMEFDPSDIDAWVNRAGVLSKLKRYGEAGGAAEHALLVHPDHPGAMREQVQARLNACDWHDRAELQTRVANALSAGRRAAQPFNSLALFDSEKLNRMAAEIYADEEFPPAQPLWRGERYAHEKIRIGYLSTDFREHAVGFLIVGALEHHDKSRFEAIGLSIGPDDKSETRARIVAAFDHFIDVNGKNDMDAAALIRGMDIDVLVDLNGYTGDARTGILARRPAPIQVNYLGYPGTMGAAYVDYIIADPVVIPHETRAFYREAVAYLPDTYQANDSRRRVSAKAVSRADAGLPEHGFVFCSLSSSYKFEPEMFGVWMRLLGAVEGSVLWLLQDNAVATANLKREAQAFGIAPDRVVFAPHAPPDEHLARQCLADLFLDTLPYNAHTTASDALWMGLPVVTCTGKAFPGRVASSILLAAGLPELVTHSLADYEGLALRLARDAGAMSALKAKIAGLRRTAALFDTARFTRHLEAAYFEMWQRQQRGAPPESFAVPRDPVR